jgi:hypothetical protein
MWMARAFQISNVLLFGQLKIFQRVDFWLGVGSLVGILALGSWAISWFKRWRQENMTSLPTLPQNQIDHYQQMVDDGLLDPDEFARIKAQLNNPTGEPLSQPPKSIPPTNEPTDSSPGL